MPDSTSAALKKFEAAFAKSYGEDALSRKTTNFYDVISTGSMNLDYAMGCGGYVRGRITELWGMPDTGKTTMMCVALAEAQKAVPDKMTAIIDVEGKFDEPWAAAHGVDLERLYKVKPETAEDVADIMKNMIQSDLFSMIGLDSIGAMITEGEMEKDAQDAVVGGAAKIITRMVKVAGNLAPQHNVAILIINQVRDTIGGMPGRGPGIGRPGGKALQHSSTHLLNFKRGKDGAFTIGADDDKVQVGQQVNIKVERNKVAPPGRSATIDMFNQETEKYGPVGINKMTQAWLMAKRLDLIERAGAFYTLPDGTRHQGEDKVKDHLATHPELVEHIRGMALGTVAHEVATDPIKEG